MGKVLLTAVLTLFAALSHGGTSSTGIIFNGNGGKVSYGDQQNRDSVKVPAIQQAPTVFYCLPEQVTVTPPLGKRFERWYDDAQLQIPTFIQPYTGGITAWENEYTPVYAGWIDADYVVIFHANGGSGTMTAQQQITGIAGNLSSNGFARANYHFVGWAETADGPAKYADGVSICLAVDPPFNSDARRYEYHLYALWEEDVYPVVYCSNDEHNYLKTNAVVVSKNVILKNTFSRQGYRFTQWNTKADGSGNTYEEDAECSYIAPEFPNGLFLYALWTPQAYEVTFIGNGGGIPSFQDKEVTYDEPYGTLPTCAREGYDFLGWWTQKTEGERIEATNIVKITTSQNLYAHWSGQQHQVTFDVAGGEAVAPIAVTYQSTYGELPTPKRKGYAFVGWFTGVTGGDRILATTTVSSMMAETLFAHWTPIVYQVAFDANSGDGEMAAQDFTYDIAAALAANTFVRTQYRFVGWADTNAVAYADGAVVSNLTALANDTFVLTAQWEKIPEIYTVTFDACGGSAVATLSVTEGETYPEFLASTRFGYEFLGWFTAADGGEQVQVGDDVREENLTLYAHWEKLTSEFSKALDTTKFYFVSETNPAWFVTNLTGTVNGSCLAICGAETSSSNPAKVRAVKDFPGGGTLKFKWRSTHFVSEPASTSGLLQIDLKCTESTVAPMSVNPKMAKLVEAEIEVPADCTEIVFSYYTEATKKYLYYAFLDEVQWISSEVPAVIEVGPGDTSAAVQEGQTLCFKKDGYDITEFLNIPEPVNGVIDLTQVTVKDEYVHEPLDPASGAVLKLDSESPSIKTAPTRAGLTYILYEGATLDGMLPGAKTIGDGEPWLPVLTVKGGASAFYMIKVTQCNE